MHRAFVHLELNTDDIQHARAFYEAVLGWSFDEVPMGEATYTQINTPVPPGAGIQPKTADELPSHWMPYVAVEDIAATIAKARDAGAEILAEPNDVEGASPAAVIKDPSGAIFGICQTPESEPVVVVDDVTEAAAAEDQAVVETDEAKAQEETGSESDGDAVSVTDVDGQEVENADVPDEAEENEQAAVDEVGSAPSKAASAGLQRVAVAPRVQPAEGGGAPRGGAASPVGSRRGAVGATGAASVSCGRVDGPSRAVRRLP